MTATPTNSPSSPIVVGIDGSEASVAALAWAVRQAKLTGASIEVVMAWEWPTSTGWMPEWPKDLDLAADALKAAEEAVASVVGDNRDVQISIAIAEGHPAPILVEKSEMASLVVVGSRGHGAFAGMLLGSVSEFLAAHAHCPVLIMHG